MSRIPKAQLLQLGLLLMLLGVTLFVIYAGQSLVVAVVSLAIFSSAGVMLVVRSQPTDS